MRLARTRRQRDPPARSRAQRRPPPSSGVRDDAVEGTFRQRPPSSSPSAGFACRSCGGRMVPKAEKPQHFSCFQKRRPPVRRGASPVCARELSGENRAIPLVQGWVGRAVPARRIPSCQRAAPAARGLAALPGFARTKSHVFACHLRWARLPVRGHAPRSRLPHRNNRSVHPLSKERSRTSPAPRSGSGGNRTNRSFCLPIGFFGEFSGTTSAIPRMEGARRATGHAPLREGGGAATDGMSMPGKRQAPGAATGGSTAGSRRGTWIAMPARSGSSPLRMAPVEAGIDGHPQYSPRRPFHSLRNRNPRTVFLRAAPPSRRAVMGLASGGAGAVWFAA